MPIRILEDRIQPGTTPSLGYEPRYPKVNMPASELLKQNTTPLNLNQPRSHEETFLDLYQNSPTTKDYNINVSADLANRISGGLGSVPYVGGALSTMADVAMPAAAFIGSPFYDAIQGTYRGIKDPDKSVWQAIEDENIGSTMWERMVGASAPLSERLSNWKNAFSTYGNAFAGDYIQNPRTRFKQQQFMNKKKQDMQRRIREAEKKRIEQEKIKTAQDNWKPTYNPASSHAEAQATGGDYHSGHQSTVGGQTTDWGSESAMIARGGLAQHAPRYANGGLIDFYRYGGFI